jgi:hypothetical protein
MTRKLTWIWLAAVFCAAGCAPSSRIQTRSLSGGNGSDACVVTMQRLQSERLPTLRSVQVWDNKYGPGLILTTDHYEVLTTVLEPLMLRTVPGFLESAYWGYNDQLPRPIQTSTKFRVYLFATRHQWEDFTRDFAGDQAAVFCKIKTGAYYLNGVCVAYDLGGSRTLFALGHEGWHQFNSRHFKYRLPSWLDEGVAMLFEASRYNDGMYEFDPSRNVHRLGALREILDSGRLIPLRDLIAMSPGEVLATDQTEAVMAFYSQSYALVRFLREAGYGKRLTCYHRMLWDALSGEWPLDESAGNIAQDRNLPRTLDWNRQVGLQVFERYVGPCSDQLEQEYLAYCQRLVCDISVVWRDNEARVAVNRRSQ